MRTSPYDFRGKVIQKIEETGNKPELDKKTSYQFSDFIGCFRFLFKRTKFKLTAYIESINSIAMAK